MGDVERVLMDPKHPHTQLLRESIPEADPNRRCREAVSLSDIEHEGAGPCQPSSTETLPNHRNAEHATCSTA